MINNFIELLFLIDLNFKNKKIPFQMNIHSKRETNFLTNDYFFSSAGAVVAGASCFCSCAGCVLAGALNGV